MHDNTDAHEEARLFALRAFEVLDTQPEEAFDRITRLAKTVLRVPIVLVSLLDRDRQWFKSRQGFEASEGPRDISFCTRAIELDEPLIVPDARLDPRFSANPHVTGAPFIRYYVGVQLKTREGYNVGTLCCIDTNPRAETSAEQLAILQDLARLVIDELELRLLATTDSLTNAMTRRAFLESARRDLDHATRHGRPLTCALLDADHFKKVNDTYSHAAGDRVLRRLVAICKAETRSSDYIGRLGGEEFALLLRDTTPDGAFDVVDRIRQAIERETFTAAGQTFTATISAGIAASAGGSEDLDALIAEADRALYRAKSAGRNRVVDSVHRLHKAS
jgi:diguanylate cyclase (GGDEF)-like protein